MGRRKFFFGDMVILNFGYASHNNHIGQIFSTQIHEKPYSRHVTYTVACECAVNIHPTADKMTPWEGPPKSIEDARLDYWFRVVGIPTPQDAEAQIDESLGMLPERQREILISRYGLKGRDRKTLDEVSIDLGVTRERIRQIQVRALRKLRLISDPNKHPPIKAVRGRGHRTILT
jgi:hypothetical protein